MITLKDAYSHRYTYFGLVVAIFCSLWLCHITGASGIYAFCTGAFFGCIMQCVANKAIIEDTTQ